MEINNYTSVFDLQQQKIDYVRQLQTAESEQ